MTPALYYCGSEVQHCNKENTQEERKKCRLLHFQILATERKHCGTDKTKTPWLHFQILATEQKHSGRDKAKTKTPWLHFQILAIDQGRDKRTTKTHCHLLHFQILTTEQKRSGRDKITTKTHCHLLHFQILATDHQLVFVLLYAFVQCWNSVDLLNLSQFWRPWCRLLHGFPSLITVSILTAKQRFSTFILVTLACTFAL